MKHLLFVLFIISALVIFGANFWIGQTGDRTEVVRRIEPEFESVPEDEYFFSTRLGQKFPELVNWERPDVPVKVALQVGHWKNNELPDELENLRGKSTGTSGGGKTEVEVAMVIAEETAKILREKDIQVDILPATITPNYWADVFLSIHADGNIDQFTSGFKAAGPWRDYTGKSRELVDLLEDNYGQITGLEIDKNITRNMRGYYAFNWWRYDHAVHPMTTAVILETGFLTSPKDQRIIINNPDLAAKGISEAILEYLDLNSLLP